MNTRTSNLGSIIQDVNNFYTLPDQNRQRWITAFLQEAIEDPPVVGIRRANMQLASIREAADCLCKCQAYLS